MSAYIGNCELSEDQVFSVLKVNHQMVLTLTQEASTVSITLNDISTSMLAESFLSSEPFTTTSSTSEGPSMVTRLDADDVATLEITGLDGQTISADVTGVLDRVTNLLSGFDLRELA